MKLDPEIPSPSQFDHVITRVPVDGKEIWLDSTPGVAPFRMLSSHLRDKQALAIPPDGKAVLVWTPADLPFEAFDRTSVVGSVNETGKLTAHVSTAARGDTEMFLRFAMRQMPSNHWKDIFDYMLQRTRMQGAEINNLKASDPSDTDDPLQSISMSPPTTTSTGRRRSRSSRCRWHPSACPARMTTTRTTTAPRPSPSSWARCRRSSGCEDHLPARSTRCTSPLGVEVKRDYAEYHSSYKFEAGQLTSHRTLKMLMPEIPRRPREDYAAFRRVVEADEAQQISLDNRLPEQAGGAGGNDRPTI